MDAVGGYRHGVGVVLFGLGHLLAVGGQHQAVDDEVLEGRLAEQGRRQDEQRVEPAARLVDALGDEVGRKVVLELAPLLERVVHLSVGHGARLEPAVEDLGDAPQRRLARPARRDRHLRHAANTEDRRYSFSQIICSD